MSTRIVTNGEVRFSYCHLMKPKADRRGNMKYSTTVLIPKSDVATVQQIQNAVKVALDAVAGKWGFVPPAIANNPHYPLKDGDTHVSPQTGKPLGEECRGHWVLTASTGADYPPEVYDQTGNKIIDHSAVYSGMWGQIAINFGAFDVDGNKGISAYISKNVLKTRDDEPLGAGAASASDDFNFNATAQQTGQTFRQTPPMPNMAQNMANINNFGFGATQPVPQPGHQQPQQPQMSPPNPFAS